MNETGTFKLCYDKYCSTEHSICYNVELTNLIYATIDTTVKEHRNVKQ